MEIPKFESAEEKKQWWAVNGETVKRDAQEARIAKMAKDKEFVESTILDREVRIVYLRLNGKPVGCLATRLKDDGLSKTMYFQFSAHNPSDKSLKDRYDRVEGKRLALQRLNENPSYVYGTPKVTAYQLKYTASQILAGNNQDFKFPEVVGYKLAAHPRVRRQIRLALEEWLTFRDMTDISEHISHVVSEISAEADESVHPGIPLG